MPTYAYQCTHCRHEFKVFQKMSDEPVHTCPECRGRVKRILAPVGVVFKGSGWYITDSRKPEKSEATAGSESKTGETKPAEAKPAAAAADSSAASNSTADSPAA